MKQVLAKVISNVHVLPEYRRSDRRLSLESRLIRLNCPQIASIARPGQFVMVRCGPDSILPRPFSIFQTSDNELAILYAVWQKGKGTEWLAGRQPGNEIQLLGPLGNGFTLYPKTQKILLIAGGIGIAPLFFLAQKAISQKISTTLLYGTAGRDQYPVPTDVRVISATEDGSIGYRGMVTDLIPQCIAEADQVFACGPLSMYRTMFRNKELYSLAKKPVQVSLEVRMGCGAGVCYSCTIKTTQGLRQVCKDGPVFDFNNVIWDEFTG